MGEVVLNTAIVVGSINRDIVAFVAVHPRPGETVLAQSGALFAGGKGANQAVAIARLGGAASFVGRVGSDAFGAEMRAYLAHEGIDTSQIAVVASAPTGLGLITVDAVGQNAITVVSGANAVWNDAALELDVAAGDIVVCQLEIPLPVVAAAFAEARRVGARTVLNAAPFQQLPENILAATDILIVNEHELAGLAGVDTPTGDGSLSNLSECAAAVLTRGPKLVVVTLGAAGAFAQQAEGATWRVPGRKVKVRDTTGAGDCFVGAFVAELLRGRDTRAATTFANAAAAVSVTRAGAADSLPKRVDVERLLSDQS